MSARDAECGLEQSDIEDPPVTLPLQMAVSVGLVCATPSPPKPKGRVPVVIPREYQRRPAPEIDFALQLEQAEA